ncbi:MAG: SDR family oxidoreductase [Microscillaceae bacterium]|nr:SDR family oxidoreductase [Microscillaceae bacterium]
MHIDLHGKKILVTGASRGIGKAIARHALLAGAKVGIHYAKSQQTALEFKEEFPHQAVPLQADLSLSGSVFRLFEESIEALDGLDVLINNAGVAIHSPLNGEDTQWLDHWHTTLNTNLLASCILSRKAVEYFLSQKQTGRIVHIASRAAFRGDTPDYLAYAASKGGMVALSHSLARAYGKQGIMSFVVAPGFTQTDMAQHFMQEYGEAHALKDIALNKLTQPEDIAPVVLLMAGGYLDHATGTTVHINAGSYAH